MLESFLPIFLCWCEGIQDLNLYLNLCIPINTHTAASRFVNEDEMSELRWKMKPRREKRWESNASHKLELTVSVRECGEAVIGWMWRGAEGSERVSGVGVGVEGQWSAIRDEREIRVRSVWCNPVDICSSMTDKTHSVSTQRHSLPRKTASMSLCGKQRLGTNEAQGGGVILSSNQSGSWLQSKFSCCPPF